MRKALILLSVFISVTLLDQWTKIWARAELIGRAPIHYLSGLVGIEYAENPGAFLSLGANLSAGVRTLILTFAVGIFLVWAIWYVLRAKNLQTLALTGWALMISGGIGNLIDRAMKNTVTDFVYLSFGPIRTGIFNVADFAIVCAVVCLLVSDFSRSRKQKV
jgi:signal peptidase II